MFILGEKNNQIRQHHVRATGRKGIALLLIAVMLCSVLPANVFSLENTVPESEDTSMPVYCLSHDVYPVTVSGSDPRLDGARLAVEAVSTSDAQTLLGDEDAVALFAYDIKIMIGGTLDEATGEYIGETEYQPTAECPVTVTIASETSIDAPVEVVHIAEGETGDIVAQPVAAVTTEENTVTFKADGFSVYIGTMGSGAGITLTPGIGYKFYSDVTCTTVIPSGQYLATLPKTIYLKADTNYFIESTAIQNENGTATTATATADNGTWTLTFPETLTENQIITVTAYVYAPGGTITTSSTAADIAAIFDATAGAGVTTTANISVTQSAGVFTVDIKNNILLRNTITLDLDTNVTLTTAGNLAIKRDVSSCLNAMFVSNGTLSLGTGTEGISTITYFFDNGSSQAIAPPHDIPTVDGATITRVEVNRNYTSTTAGNLTLDGGAVFTTPIDAETKTMPVCSSVSTGSIIETTGTLKMWDDVTLKNNYNDISNDANSYAGIQLKDGNFYMYGGMITQCSTRRSGSTSDGGGICFTDGDAFFYGGIITQCCADNGAGVAIFGVGKNPTAYYLGTDIQYNLAGGDRNYPGQACSAYAGAALRMYAGVITNNKNIFFDYDADYDMKPSGDNSGVDLFGGTIGKLGVVALATVNVYSCSIGQIQGVGTVNYRVGKIVTVPDCMPLNTTDSIIFTVDKVIDGEHIAYISITKNGDGISTGSEWQLPPGEYAFSVESPSMRKEYSAIVIDRDVTALPQRRILTSPILKSRTVNSITLVDAGTLNPTADGEMQYGFSSTNDINSVPQTGLGSWQSNPHFASGVTGELYFFIKVSKPSPDTYNFGESFSSGLLADFNIEPTVVINSANPAALAANRTHTVRIITTPEKYDPACVKWTVSGAEHPETAVIADSNGNGHLTIAAGETATSLTLTVELLDKDLASISGGVTNTITIQINPYSYIEQSHTEMPTTLTARIIRGTGGPYEYRWERDENTTGSYSVIPGATGSTYDATTADIGKNVRVVIIDNAVEYVSVAVIINSPQLSVTVPTTMTVTVNAAGECTAANTSILNNTAIGVYVTDVVFEWITNSAGNDANELFNDYRLVTAKLKLNLDSEEYSFSGETPAAAFPTAAAGVIPAKVGTTAGEIPLNWTFDIGANNFLHLAPAAGQSLQMAIVTYTIGYQPPTGGG